VWLWSVGLEFPAGQLAESDYWREQFQTIPEDVSVRNALMHSAHYRFHDDALYKSSFHLLTSLLTYSLVAWAQEYRLVQVCKFSVGGNLRGGLSPGGYLTDLLHVTRCFVSVGC